MLVQLTKFGILKKKFIISFLRAAYLYSAILSWSIRVLKSKKKKTKQTLGMTNNGQTVTFGSHKTGVITQLKLNS